MMNGVDVVVPLVQGCTIRFGQSITQTGLDSDMLSEIEPLGGLHEVEDTPPEIPCDEVPRLVPVVCGVLSGRIITMLGSSGSQSTGLRSRRCVDAGKFEDVLVVDRLFRAGRRRRLILDFFQEEKKMSHIVQHVGTHQV